MKASAANSIGASLQALAAQAPAAQRPHHALPPRPRAAAREASPAPSARLTPRQLEVLALLCEGLPNKLICRQLNIATGTVKVHMTSILRELGVATRLQAVVEAHRRGLVGEAAGGRGQERPAFATVAAGLPVRAQAVPSYRDAVAF